MSDLSSALLTSISQRSEESAAPRLAGSVVARGVVSSAERREMYRLLEIYFAGTSLGQFEADLAEKELVFLLRDSVTGQIQGFSTSMRLSARIDDEDIVAFSLVTRSLHANTGATLCWPGYGARKFLLRLTLFMQCVLRPGCIGT
jgi:hypothetical protein